MIHQLSEKWYTLDVFYLMEELARETSLDAEMTVYEENDDHLETVSLGLEREMYKAAYTITSETDITVIFPGGGRIAYTHWKPGQLIVEGSEKLDKIAQEKIAGFVPAPSKGASHILFSQTRKLLEVSVNERLRRFHRAAAAQGAAMYLTDLHRNGKLIRINATWMLDVYENPIDVVIRFSNGGWFLFHNADGRSYTSTERFFEAEELLNILQI